MLFVSGYKKDHTLKYEAACQITSGRICWSPVPALPGLTADIQLYEFYNLGGKLENGEYFLGDSHYQSIPNCLKNESENYNKLQSLIKQLFERLKTFNCLKL